MDQLSSQLTIIGEQQDPSRIAVEPPHWIDALLSGCTHEINHRHPLLRVIGGGDAIARLIEEHVDFILRLDLLTIDLHAVIDGHLSAKSGHRSTVYQDGTGCD